MKFSAFWKMMNGKMYTVQLRGRLNTKEVSEVKIRGLLAPIRTRHFITATGTLEGFNGYFLTDSKLNHVANELILIAENNITFALNLEYDLFTTGNNKLINNINHASYRMKQIQNYTGYHVS